MKNKLTISEKINLLFAEENYSGARKLLLGLLKENANDHWLLTRLSTTYYEEKNYKKALEFSRKAIEISPDCPLSLWDYAGALEMTGETKRAIDVWKKLFSMDIEKLANDNCGEGVTRAKALQMDCAFRIGIAYATLRELSKSKEYFDKHLKLRHPGNRSIYDLKYVKDRIKRITTTNTVYTP
jgi:tetratricopeptide (TPR) repeat protein